MLLLQALVLNPSAREAPLAIRRAPTLLSLPGKDHGVGPVLFHGLGAPACFEARRQA